MRKGWFEIPGLQRGDRPLEAQIAAIRPALAEARGKTVLDLGMAEGLIAIEFARAGAQVLGSELVAGNVEMAEQLKAREPQEIQARLVFETRELTSRIAAEGETPRQFDIVVALGILHKLDEPRLGVQYVIKATRHLLLMRSGQAQKKGIITSKYRRSSVDHVVDAHALLTAAGFRMEKMLSGPAPWRENVEYWRRAA